jgi:hypothetical protein
MGYSYGFINGRDVGYGVPAVCDQPECNTAIDRGLGYICGGDIAGGEHGCGLFFCWQHLVFTDGPDNSWDIQDSPQLCDNCSFNFELGSDQWKKFKKTYSPKPDVKEWLMWKLEDESWEKWRANNPEEVERMKTSIRQGEE